MVFNREIYYPTYCRLDPLLLGVGAAAWRTFRPEAWRRLERHGLTVALGGSALLAAVAACFGPQPIALGAVLFEYPMIAAALACLLFYALSPGASRIRVPGARVLAELAFTLYLVHKPVIHWVLTRGGGLPSCVAGSLAHAWMLRQAVELPFLRLRDRIDRARRDARAQFLEASGTAATERIMATARSTSGPSGS